MGHTKELLVLFLSVALNLADSQTLVNTMKRDNACVYDCKNAVFPLPNKDVDPQGTYARSCCMRGCRFYNLIDLRREYEPNNFNTSLDDCNASCKEAYTLYQNLFACVIGCSTMARRTCGSTTTRFRIDIRVEDNINPELMLASPDITDNKLLTETRLAKEFLSGWWDSSNDDGIELQGPPFKYLPHLSEQTIDYDNPLEFVKENEKPTSSGGSDWLQCASKHTGIPQWLLAFAIFTAAISALWLCLSPDKVPNEAGDKVPLVDSGMKSNNIMVYLPDEAPLHKIPPPKYQELEDELTLKV